jgi:4,5-DOPA dioxygenase extradiol
MLPSFFICHGAPLLAVENNEYTESLRNIALSNPKPKAVVVFTAHWESDILTVSYTDETYETIYDFYGFPEELYQIKYPAKGSTQVADEIIELFNQNGIQARKNTTRGLDHGVWVILRHMYPQADIPVISISVNPNLSPIEHYNIGKAIRILKEKDICIIGSGGLTHNLQEISWRAKAPFDWTLAFDDWMIDKITAWDTKALFSYEELAPYAKRAVPRNEHLDPLFIMLGTGEDKKTAELVHRSYQYGSLSMVIIKMH